MKNLVQKYTFIACLACAVATTHGATVLWSSSLYPVSGFQGSDLETGVFNISGTLIYAENSGGAATVFDGINFSAGDASLVSGGDYSGFHAGTNTPLAQTGRYSSGQQTITLGNGLIPNLVIGQAYRIQLLIADGRGGAAGRRVSFDGSDLGQYGNAVGAPDYSWGPPLLVTGTFTADATEQAFTMDNFDADGGSVGAQYNALLLHQVPEPSAALLGGLGSLTLLRRRRMQSDGQA